MRTAPTAVPVLAALLLGLLAAGAPAAGDPLGPRTAGDEPVDEALASLADRVDDQGCVVTYGECRASPTKWVTVVAASAGADPTAWPAPDASVGGWLRNHADDLRDRQARDCDGETTQEHVCSARRVRSLAKAVLAVEAAGLEARSLPLPDGGTRDLVAEINAEAAAGQYGSPSYVNDDVFALLALRAAGWDGPEARDAADFVASNQNPDGGLGYAPGTDSSTDTTAAAVMAMAPRNRTGFVGPALDYVAEAQVREGDGAACFSIRADGDRANAASTAWAIQALVAAGENPLDRSVDGTRPTDCLLRYQAPSGAFANSLDEDQDQTNLAATLDALGGLTWIPFGAADGPVEPRLREPTTRAGTPVTLAADDGFLVRGGEATAEVTVAPAEPGSVPVRGWTWSPDPRPLRVRLQVHPPVPGAPAIQAPAAPTHGDPVPVRVEAPDRWTETLQLTLPNGTTLAGAHHLLDLPPGHHRLEATARNALGEAGPPTTHTLSVRNPGPTVSVDGPRQAAPDAPADLQATARDPDGDDVSLRWEAPDGSRLATGPNLTLAPDPGGDRTVVAVAADAHGATVRTPHEVRWTGAPPNVTLHAPPDPVAGEATLSAEASHPREPVSVSWYHDGAHAGNGTRITLPLGPGNHALRVVAATPNATAEAAQELQVREPREPASPPQDPAPEPAAADPGDGGDPDEARPTRAAEGAPAASRGVPAAGPLAVLLAGLAAALGRRS